MSDTLCQLRPLMPALVAPLPSVRGTMDVQPEKRRDLGRRLELLWEDDGVYYRVRVEEVWGREIRRETEW